VLDPDYLESLKKEQRNVALFEVIRDAVDGGHLRALQTCLHYAHNHPDLVAAAATSSPLSSSSPLALLQGGDGVLAELPAMVARCEALLARVQRDHAHWLKAARAALQGGVPNRSGVARYIGQPGKEFAQGLPVLASPSVPGHSFKAVYAKDSAVVLPTGAEFSFSATITKKHRHKDGHDYDVTFFKLAQVFNVEGLPKKQEGGENEEGSEEDSPFEEGWVCDLQTDSVKKEPHGTGVLSYFKQKQIMVLSEATPPVRASDLANVLAVATEGTTRNGVALHLRDGDAELLADARVRLGVLQAEEELAKRIAEAMASGCLEPVEACLHLYKVLYVVDQAAATSSGGGGGGGGGDPSASSGNDGSALALTAAAPSAPGGVVSTTTGSTSTSGSVPGCATVASTSAVAPLGSPGVAAARALLTQSSSCLPWPYGEVALGFPSPALKRTVTKCEACMHTRLKAIAMWKETATLNLQAALDATSRASFTMVGASVAANAMHQLEHALELAEEGVDMHGVRISIADNTALLGRAQIRLSKLRQTAEKRTMSAPVVTFASGNEDANRLLADKMTLGDDDDDKHFFDDIIRTNRAGLLGDEEGVECTFQPTLVSSKKNRAREHGGDDENQHLNEEDASNNNRHELLYQHAFFKAERLSRAAEEQALAATSANFQPDLSLTAARRAQSANDVEKPREGGGGGSASPQQSLHQRFEKLFSDQVSQEERKAKKAAQRRAAEEAACPFVPSQISKPPAATASSAVESNGYHLPRSVSPEGSIGGAVDDTNAPSMSRTEALYLDAHRRLQSQAVARENEQAQLKDSLFAPDLSASAKVTAAAYVEGARAKSYSDLLATTAVPPNVLLKGNSSAFQRLHLDAAARAARHDASAAQRLEQEAQKCTYSPALVANPACNPRKAADVTPTKTEAARLKKISAKGEMARRKADEAVAARRAQALAEIAAVAANGNLLPKAN